MTYTKKLTLAITIYDLSVNEINNWFFIATKIKEIPDVHLIFLNDNPDRDLEYSELFKEFDYVKCKENKGKYQLAKDAVDQNLIKGRWVKFCDPDDFILINRLNAFVKVLNKFDESDETPLIKFEYSRIIYPSETWDITDQEHIFGMSMLRRFPSLINYNTVIPTETLKNFPLEAKNQTKSSDVLFSLSWDQSEDKSITYINIPFYVYNYLNGVSGYNKKEQTKLRRVKNDRMIMELFTFLDIMNLYRESNNLLTPSFFDYKWLHNNLINKRVSLIKRIFYTRKAFKKLKKVAKNNKIWKVKWSLFEKIKYTLIFNVFKIKFQ